MPNKIQLPLFDLEYDKIVKKIEHFITLNDKYILWHLECYLDKLPRPEDAVPQLKENEFCKHIDFILKIHCGDLESYFDNEKELWVMTLFFLDKSIDCKFETEAEMRSVELKIRAWLIT